MGQTMTLSAAFGALLGLTSWLPAAADDRPPVQPTRDVTVEYQIAAQPGAPNVPRVDRLKIYYTANATRLRVEPAGQPMYMLMDRDAKRMTVVMPDQRSYMEMPIDPKKIAGLTELDANTSFTKRGTDTVAGKSCTVWDVKGPASTGTVCMTGDGVMLRAHGEQAQHRGDMEAVSVVYGAQPANLFTPPDGFQKMDIPQRPGVPPARPGGARPPG